MGQELKLVLYQALAAPIGLLVQTSNFPRARQRLYAARAEIGDPELAGLQFRSSPVEGGDLIIVKQRINLSEPQL